MADALVPVQVAIDDVAQVRLQRVHRSRRGCVSSFLGTSAHD
jgi:hypothetical protein